MKKEVVCFLAIAVMFTACSHKQGSSGRTKTEVFTNDMDQYYSIKKVSNAHSGSYVSVMDSISLYSVGLKRRVGDIQADSIQKIKVTVNAWVYMLHPAIKSLLVFSVDDKSQNIYWTATGLDTQVKEARKWTPVTATFDMPKNAMPDHNMATYFWNNNKADSILVDDFEVTFK